jgi:hypothetical protein
MCALRFPSRQPLKQCPDHLSRVSTKPWSWPRSVEPMQHHTHLQPCTRRYSEGLLTCRVVSDLLMSPGVTCGSSSARKCRCGSDACSQMSRHCLWLYKFLADDKVCVIVSQVNLDFESEGDMVDIMRLSIALQPVATALFANSPFDDGKPSGYLSWRSHVWQRTDPDRWTFPPANPVSFWLFPPLGTPGGPTLPLWSHRKDRLCPHCMVPMADGSSACIERLR